MGKMTTGQILKRIKEIQEYIATHKSSESSSFLEKELRHLREELYSKKNKNEGTLI